MKDGKVVYVQNILNIPCDPFCNWLPVAIFVLAVASVIVANIDYKKEVVKKYDKDGNVIGTEEKIIKSFGGGSVITPSKSIIATSTPEILDTPIEIDNLYVLSSRIYPEEIPSNLSGNIEEVILTSNTQKDIIIFKEQLIEKEPFEIIDNYGKK